MDNFILNELTFLERLSPIRRFFFYFGHVSRKNAKSLEKPEIAGSLEDDGETKLNNGSSPSIAFILATRTGEVEMYRSLKFRRYKLQRRYALSKFIKKKIAKL